MSSILLACVNSNFSPLPRDNSSIILKFFLSKITPLKSFRRTSLSTSVFYHFQRVPGKDHEPRQWWVCEHHYATLSNIGDGVSSYNWHLNVFRCQLVMKALHHKKFKRTHYGPNSSSITSWHADTPGRVRVMIPNSGPMDCLWKVNLPVLGVGNGPVGEVLAVGTWGSVFGP